MMKRFIKYGVLAAVVITVTSCHHKELCFDHNHRRSINVVFDWSNAPDGNPESMALYLYNVESGEYIRYNFTGRDGGSITVPGGQYNALCINDDNTDWVDLVNYGDIGAFETRTHDAEFLSGYGIETRALPRADGTENIRVAETPGMLWSDRTDGFSVSMADTEKTLTLYPEEAVCHYSVEVVDVKNIEYLDDVTLDATLSGMAEGFLHGRRESTDSEVIMPFTLEVDKDKNSLIGTFLTFGECSTNSPRDLLTIYTILADGSKKSYIFDVTTQVHEAPDPRHVYIKVKGLDIPQPISSGGGLHPDVENWETEYVNLQM